MLCIGFMSVSAFSIESSLWSGGANLALHPPTYLPVCPPLCPSYLRDLCCPVSDLAARRVLRSAARGELLVPRARLAIMQQRAFSVVGPSSWNDLPVELRSLLMASPSKFY